jgi:hypothetical protein
MLFQFLFLIIKQFNYKINISPEISLNNIMRPYQLDVRKNTKNLIENRHLSLKSVQMLFFKVILPTKMYASIRERKNKQTKNSEQML